MPTASLFPQKKQKAKQKQNVENEEDVIHEGKECRNERKEVQGGERQSYKLKENLGSAQHFVCICAVMKNVFTLGTFETARHMK